MKKPKIKKRRKFWLVYTDKKRAFKCFDLYSVNLCYKALCTKTK